MCDKVNHSSTLPKPYPGCRTWLHGPTIAVLFINLSSWVYIVVTPLEINRQDGPLQSAVECIGQQWTLYETYSVVLSFFYRSLRSHAVTIICITHLRAGAQSYCAATGQSHHSNLVRGGNRRKHAVCLRLAAEENVVQQLISCLFGHHLHRRSHLPSTAHLTGSKYTVPVCQPDVNNGVPELAEKSKTRGS